MPSIYWKDYSYHLMGLVANLYKNSELTDCILDTEEESIRCHKTILAASSPYFKKLFMDHVGMEIIPFKHVNYNKMKLILNFIYYGEVDVPHSDVASLMETAELLQISAFTQVLLKENSVVCYQDVLSKRGQELNSSCHNIDSQPLVDLETKAVNVLCEMSVNVNEDESKGSIPNSRVEEATVCEDPEEFENEMKPITFVAVSPASVTSEELDEERALPVTDPLLHNSLDSEDNCESTEVMNDEGENNLGSLSNIEMEIKQEVDVCGSESVSFACEKKHSCDELTMPMNDNMLNAIECTSGFQSNQTVTTVKNEGSIFDTVEECEVEFESICDISDNELKVKNSFVTCLDVENLNDNGRKKSEVLNYGALDSSVFKCVNIPPNQVEVDNDSSVSNLMCGSWKMQVKHTEQENDTTLCRGEDQESLNCTQSDAEIVSEPTSNRHVTSHLGDSKDVCQSELTFDRELSERTKTPYASKNRLKNKKRIHSVIKPFSCDTCGSPFSYKSQLEIHTRCHTQEKPFKCATCKLSFGFKSNLAKHLRIHTGEKPFACGSCGASFSEKCSLQKHIRTHTGEKPFTCTTCGVSFAQSSALLRHMRIHTREFRFLCDTCGAPFIQKGHLNRHKLTHTGEKPFRCANCGLSFSNLCHLAIHTRNHPGENPFKCTTCRLSFTSKCHLVMHTRTHSGGSIEACESSFGENTRARHTEPNTAGKLFECGECGALFSEESKMVRHTNTHSSDKPYVCDTCGLSFPVKSHLMVHTRIHNGEKPFECGTCKASFCYESSLVRHIRTHTGEKPFHCGTCKASFSEKSGLMKHMLTHTGEKPFTCTFCVASFSQKSNLTNHMRTHTGEKPFGCVNCKASFSNKQSLVRHMRYHTPEMSSLCSTSGIHISDSVIW